MDYLPLILFAISTSITPGPNNTLMLASGVNHGLKKSLPHLLGIGAGCPVIVIFVGLGVGSLFAKFPFLQIGLKVVGTGYLLYLAYKVASAPVHQIEIGSKKPFTFLQAALFQWVNPKVWIMAIGAVVSFTTTANHYFVQVVIVALAFVLFGLPCVGLWLLCGASLKKLLSNPVYLRAFNIAMAALLVISLMPVLRELCDSYAASPAWSLYVK